MSVYKTFKLNDLKSVFVTRNLKKTNKNQKRMMGHNQNQRMIQETKKGRSPRELVGIFITRSGRCLGGIDQSQVVNPNFEFQQKREEL